MAENDFSINDEPTMRPKEERGGRGAFALGNVIAGRYVVEKVLGEGGMGIVYQCLDKVGGVSVAVKCLPPEVSRNADEMEDIRANYRLVSDLHHPNIACARTLEVDGSTGDYYLVMDLARGTSLKRWARRNSQATMATKLAILRQVAAALDYAHARKVIHRDVKPENVMVDDEGVVKVLDFGLAAQIRSSQSRTSAAVTSRGGTPGYKSPEQWRGKPQREPADVYSFGVMAYWMFAGALPFDGDDSVVLGHAVLTEPVEPIAGIPAHMNAALVKALAKEPNERFASCGAFMDALEGKGDFSHKEPVVSRVPRDRTGGSRSRATVKGILVATLLAALAGGGYYGWTKYDEGVKAREAQQAEERARLEKSAEEHIARLKAEKDKVEAEKRKIEAEREKREKELAEERMRLEKERNASAKPETATELTLAEQEARQKEVARLAELRVDIGIKCDDAKEKMGRLAAYRGEPDGFKAHIDNADANWKIVKAVERNPATVPEAEKSLKSVTEAENAIAKELHWLNTNKAARDGAKATEVEIARAIDPELKRFKADDYARVIFAAGDRLRKEGNAALANGDFPLAKETLDSAKAKLSEAAANAKRFCIDTHLNTAKKWIAASRWQQCLEECDTLLGWDSANAEAKKLKRDAESHLVPSLQVVAKIDGSEVPGAKVKAGSQIFTTPFVWKLKEGCRYGPYAVSYESGGKRYDGTIDSVTVDWRGSRVFPVVLKEYTGPKGEAKEGVGTLSKLQSGGDDLDKLLSELSDVTPSGGDDLDNLLSALDGVVPSSVEPSVTIVATLNGRKVGGAKLNDGKNDYVLPVTWSLRGGLKYGPYKVSREIEGRRYYGTFDAITVDWRGSKVISVALSASGSKPKTTSVVLKGRHRGVQLWEGGPYWADRNIGAEKPEDYGYYFWWGDTVGYKHEGDSWVASDGSTRNFSFNETNTPTCNKHLATLQSEGWITPVDVLAPAHDAAHVHWGGAWRMPTKQELDDLGYKCDWNWTTINGVKGYVVYGRGNYASQSIFLPCAGKGSASSYGGCWSSVPKAGIGYSWYLYFNSSDHGMSSHGGRNGGESVRPVQGFTQ